MDTASIAALQRRLRGHALEELRDAPPWRAAVLIPLLERQGEIHVLFEERQVGIRQGGDICFPGGHVEPGESEAEAAVRESAEELLLEPGQIELICPLHRLIGERNREVCSYLGVLHGYLQSYATDEVSRTFTLPLPYLQSLTPEIYTAEMAFVAREDFPYDLIPGGRDYPFRSEREDILFYRTPMGVIWGLTAKFLHAFLQTLAVYTD